MIADLRSYRGCRAGDDWGEGVWGKNVVRLVLSRGGRGRRESFLGL